jgi:hypothetical protein
VRLPSGEVKVYGDQDWVRSELPLLLEHPDGEIVVRDVEITQGEWRSPEGEDTFYPTFISPD